MNEVMNESIITKDDLARAVETTSWMDASETVKEYFRLENAAREGIIEPRMTFVEALTAMIVAESNKSKAKRSKKNQKRKETIKNKTIYVLPKLSADMTGEEFHDQFMANWELAATIDYVPDSIETLRAIEYSQIKTLMSQNEKFFNAVVELCADMIDDLIKFNKEYATEQYEEKEIDESEYEAVRASSTLDDLLNSGCLGNDYEDSKDEFVSEFVEVYLFSDKY